MPLPRISGYDMPDVPADAAVRWSLQRGRAALLIHDMQAYFLRPFADDSAPLADLMSNVHALREACAEHDLPVIFSMQPGGQSPAERGLLKDFWGEGMSAHPADTALPDPLAPRPGEHTIIKRRYSAFHGTSLEHLLTDLGRDQLIICGVYAHIGVLHTAADAMMRDIQPFVVADGVADFDRPRHETALDYISALLGRTLTTRTLITALSQQRLAVSRR
ncbi:isochorismatase family protein [Nonomuraea sp. NPDC046802]|uniref:isochorismatase family protein n=1 Tax=Nonomuraea sp. NPDC046802 TaxID=3154919 RepID=UPI0033E582B2